MKSSLQVQTAVAKAMQTLGMMKRSYKYLSKDLFLFLYKICIRPHLEYCAPTWSPYLARHRCFRAGTTSSYKVSQEFTL